MRLILLISLCWPLLASAETSLWRISKNGGELYLGGTVHLLSQSDYPLPDEYEQAFRSADRLVLEADLKAFENPETKRQLLKSLLYSDGTTLKSRVKPETYRALARYCRANGLSPESLQFMKPSLAVLTLTMAKLKKLDMAGAGVDQFFLEKAVRQKKPVSGLENAGDQIKALENMGKGLENELILSTIKEIRQTKGYVNGMVKAWRTGNLAELENIGIKPMREEFPGLQETLLGSRNRSWLPKIEAMLKTKERELILVGALHLAGGDGVLAQLKSRGYLVEQY